MNIDIDIQPHRYSLAALKRGDIRIKVTITYAVLTEQYYPTEDWVAYVWYALDDGEFTRHKVPLRVYRPYSGPPCLHEWDSNDEYRPSPRWTWALCREIAAAIIQRVQPDLATGRHLDLEPDTDADHEYRVVAEDTQ